METDGNTENGNMERIKTMENGSLTTGKTAATDLHLNNMESIFLVDYFSQIWIWIIFFSN